MKPRVILSIVIVALGAVVAIIPQINNKSGIPDAKQLLRQLADNSHMIDPDDVANALINQDPSIQLIDVRKPEEYAKFSLPGAINIPIDSLLSENSIALLDLVGKKNVYYSTGTVLAGEAVVITKTMGYKNTYVLKGGLNKWFEDIVNPEEPGSVESLAEFELYQKRIGEKQFFTGNKIESVTNSATSTNANPSLTKKKKQKVQGGCG